MPRYRRPALEGPRASREQLGLPEGKHLYYCPQNLFKLHPDFDAAIRAILEGDPEAELVLLEFVRACVAEQLLRRFELTLGALASKIRFVPRSEHRKFLQYVAAADVILDPFHFGGCNSSCDALSLGVPVVTLPGSQLPGRFTLGRTGGSISAAASPGRRAGSWEIRRGSGAAGDLERWVRGRFWPAGVRRSTGPAP